MKITDGKRQVRDTRIYYKGRLGVIVSARVGRKPKPIIAYIQFQFGDRDTFDISEAVWVEEKRAWVVE